MHIYLVIHIYTLLHECKYWYLSQIELYSQRTSLKETIAKAYISLLYGSMLLKHCYGLGLYKSLCKSKGHWPSAVREEGLSASICRNEISGRGINLKSGNLWANFARTTTRIDTFSHYWKYKYVDSMLCVWKYRVVWRIGGGTFKSGSLLDMVMLEEHECLVERIVIDFTGCEVI